MWPVIPMGYATDLLPARAAALLSNRSQPSGLDCLFRWCGLNPTNGANRGSRCLQTGTMKTSSVIRTAKVRSTLTKRSVDAFEPNDQPWIARHEERTGFGLRVDSSGAKSFFVNLRNCAPRELRAVRKHDPFTPV